MSAVATERETSMDLDSLLELVRIKSLLNEMQRLTKDIIRCLSKDIPFLRLIFKGLASFQPNTGKFIVMVSYFAH